MKDISLHLQEAHHNLKICYEKVNLRDNVEALKNAEDALFHVRCCVLWLKEKLDATEKS